MNELLASIIALMPVCAPDVHQDTMTALIQTESSFNQYAVAVVDKNFPPYSQPKSFDEAKALIDELEASGKNYSVGLGQINRTNFARFNVSAVELLDPCLNLRISQEILKECYVRSGNNLNDSLSCYYSGNFKTGYQGKPLSLSYVAAVHSNAPKPAVPSLNEYVYKDPYKDQTTGLKGFTTISTPSQVTNPGIPIKNFSLINNN